jgi:hypothetical protein
MMTNSNCDDEISAFESIMMYAVCRMSNEVVISTSWTLFFDVSSSQADRITPPQLKFPVL